MENSIMIPAFSVKEVSGVTFGGFAVDPFMFSKPNKLPWRNVTLPQAMIAAADKGKGSHLLTAFQWASMAYLWKDAQRLDDCPVDLHAETWQWVMGLFMHKNGHVDVLASLDVTVKKSPYGRGTLSGSGGATPTLTLDGAGVNWLKAWTPDAFNAMSVYIAEASSGAGAWYTIASTTATTLVLANGSAPGNGTATFVICKHISTDVGGGCSSGQRILTLRNTDADLKGFAIPATTDGTGAAAYGNDGYWFDRSALRAAVRGGNFGDGAGAGVFALNLLYAPSSHADYSIGFRAGKAL